MRPPRVPALGLGRNLDIGTRRATGLACWENSIYLVEIGLGRGSAGNAGRADKIDTRRQFFSEGKSGRRSSCVPGYLSRGLRNGGAPYVADLAMILVRRVAVPVGDRVRRKGCDCQH